MFIGILFVTAVKWLMFQQPRTHFGINSAHFGDPRPSRPHLFWSTERGRLRGGGLLHLKLSNPTSWHERRWKSLTECKLSFHFWCSSNLWNLHKFTTVPGPLSIYIAHLCTPIHTSMLLNIVEPSRSGAVRRSWVCRTFRRFRRRSAGSGLGRSSQEMTPSFASSSLLGSKLFKTVHGKLGEWRNSSVLSLSCEHAKQFKATTICHSANSL